MYAHLAHHYDELFPLDDQIKPFLEGFLYSQGNALDLGCGTGRLTQIMHDGGMQVIGIDLDEVMIEVARMKHPDVHFKVQNMLDAFEDKTYDLITCFGNTLPHLDEKSLENFLKLVSNHLSNRGVLIIQMLNYDLVMRNRPRSLKTIEKPNLKFERLYTYIDDHISFETRLTIHETTLSGTHQLYPHLMSTLTHLIEKNQMKPTFLGDDLKSTLNPNAPYMTILIHKT